MMKKELTQKRRKRMEEAATKFGRWLIFFGGDYKLSRTMDVAPSTIWHWKKGTRIPRHNHIVEIIKLSKNSLDYFDCLEPFKLKNFHNEDRLQAVADITIYKQKKRKEGHVYGNA